MPGSTMRHSSSRCAAAASSEISSFLPVPTGLRNGMPASSKDRTRSLVPMDHGAEGDRVAQLLGRRNHVLPAPARGAVHLICRARCQVEDDGLIIAAWIVSQAP